MAEQHTPGPWKNKTTYLGHENNRRNIIIGVEGCTNNIARVFSPDATLAGMTSQAPESRAEAEANARIIEVAPDMLTALEARSRAGHKVERHVAGAISSSHAGRWEDCPIAECQADHDLIAAARGGGA
jgi:hypothetical protein